MNYSTIKQLDIANGKGCRISIFVNGCDFNCPGCFNKEQQDFKGGKPFTDQVIALILSLAEPEHISGLSILGGEPLHPHNRPEVFRLVSAFKKKYPNKDVWVWTGYEFEDVIPFLVNSDIDVIVDGLFIEELKDPRLKYRGSSNQRVIDVKASLNNYNVTLYE